MSAKVIINADDYAPGRYARTKILTEAGFDVKEAGTGQDALRLATELKPELMILDIDLPDMNGMDVSQRLKQNPVTSGVIVLHLADSKVLPVDMLNGPDSGADGYLTEPVDPTVLITTVRALLRARQAEEELRRSNDELQHFAYMVSHELNEPLRMVTSYTQLLAKRYEDKLDATAGEYMGQTVTAAKRMQTFVQDILNYSRATTPDLNFGPVSTEAVLATALYELRLTIKENDAVITNDPLPEVFGNEMRLVRVFVNLIANSIKYRRDEAPRIHISAREQDRYWRFEFRDNGIGIERQYWEQIFEVFKRLHGRDIPGTGIGLALSKRVIENHGGTIWLESQPGAGSTFFFTLPRPGEAAVT